MSKLSAHFDKSEFICKCGCNQGNPSSLLISRLEKLYKLMNAKAIIVNSGYRCYKHDKAVGGSGYGAHTKNIAADIVVKKQDGTLYSAEEIAEAAERIGFGGIGMMNNACHVDTRDSEKYDNNHWFGDERDGRNYIKTFQRGTVFDGEKTPAPQEDHSKDELLAELKALYEKYS